MFETPDAVLFGILSFGFVSDFVLRISCFAPPQLAALARRELGWCQLPPITAIPAARRGGGL
jgi:hypothetical protein